MHFCIFYDIIFYILLYFRHYYIYFEFTRGENGDGQCLRGIAGLRCKPYENGVFKFAERLIIDIATAKLISIDTGRMHHINIIMHLRMHILLYTM